MAAFLQREPLTKEDRARQSGETGRCFAMFR